MTHFFRNLALATTALLPLGIGFAVAGPTGGVVVGGEATIRDQGSRNVTIDQWSQRAIINWYTFNIGAGESTRFNQPDSSSVVLNRVTGGVGPSEIFGTVTANGRVFVINRDGILFGPNAVIDTAGFLATTSDIKNDDFMAGRYNFNIPGRPDASIVNHGTITAQSAGFAALVAPGVRNTGTITATLGTVGLAAGNSFTLDLYGDKLITLAVGDSIAGQVRDVQTGQTLNSLVENTGRLRANGGRVELTAAAARTVVDSVINNTGVVEANRIGQRGGTIVLSAATAGTKGAGAPKQTVKLSGTLSAAAKDGGKGGKVVVTGEDIQVTGAHVDVSGPAGGGTVLIGGDWGGGSPTGGLVKHPGARLENEKIPTAATVTIDRNTVINASATSSGTGGKVIVWSDEKTSFAGTILATGGPSGGDGGFAEVSGHHLDFTGLVDLRAPMGRAGTLLLDPLNYYINYSGEAPENDPTASAIAASTVQNLLKTAHVTITTQPGEGAGDIFVQSSINWATAFSLTLSAFRDINLAAGVTIKNTYAEAGAGTLLTLRADNTGAGTGTVKFALGGGYECYQCYQPPAKVDFSQSTGRVAIYYNPPSYEGENRYFNPIDYSGKVLTNSGIPKQLTAYMLVNNADDLFAIGQNSSTRSQTYALGTSFSAAEYNFFFRPGTRFTGIFDGYGGIGENNYISDLAFTLFPIIGRNPDGSGGIVRNLNLTDVNIISEGSGRFGALAGLNEGTISGVSVSGSIITYGAGVIAGGLVGENRGLITQSTASVLVSVGDGTTGPNGGFNYAGGLVGINTGTISQSSAGGFVPTIGGSIPAVVEGGINSFVGGLVGQNGTGQPGGGGLVESSSASAFALGFGSVGGLVGFNAAGATITGSAVTDGFIFTTGSGFAGGLVGQNDGLIVSSSATGLVAGFGGAILGLVDSSSSLASSSLARPTFTLGQPGQYVSIGGLVGVNHGTVQDSSASASVFGLFANAGGLVGYNSGSIIGTSPGQVRAEGTVMVDGDHSTGGGLVGFNAAGGTIHNAAATGEVTAGLFFAGLDPSFAVGPQFTNTGGLVGQNAGSIDHSIAAVTVQGGFGSAGGLVGQNDGLISTSSASGAVSGSGFAGALASLGGLVGTNQGTVQDSSAAATVVGSFAYAGGLVGFNSGTIIGTNPGQVRADGTVTVDGAHSAGGGLVGFNAAGGSIHNAGVTGTVAIGLFGTSTDVLNLGGLVGQNAGSIDHSVAAVTVQGGFGSAGGLVGQNDGLISTSSASGAVSGSGLAGAYASLGGLVGINHGTVQDSSAAATVVGSFVYAGGLVGFNSGTITGTNPGQVRADGTVMVDGDHSTAGGLVGFNALGGIIHNSGASGSVAIGLFGTSTDVLNLGGLVGQNAGSIDHSVAAVTVQGGLGSAGGLVGHNDGVISASSASGLVSGSGFDGRFVMLGGLVGNNNAGGQITDSSASGAVALGTFGNAGGLVGFNRGFIANSSASGAVTSDGLFTAIGGLVGYNSVGAHISNSQASGSVTSLANASSETETTDAGGLVGINYGILTNTGASGAVSVGAHGNGGGLVGFNGGTIATSFATGAVTGAAGLPDSGPDNGHHTHLGGLAGTNQGTITDSGASGEVGSAGVAFLTAGGLVGDNSGTILRSFALGNVRVGDHSTAGGLVGDNSASDCQGCIIGDGHSNEARIADSQAGGSVTGGSGSLLGGLAASNSGSLTNTFATGAVSGGNDSVIGGLVGVVDVGATITNSQAHGSVSGLGIHSVVGGLVGVSFGTIAGSRAAGAVTAASQSYAGGLVGINLGNVQQSLALSSVSVTGTGTRSILGGLVGMNAGTINLSASSASVIGGSLSSVGGLVGANVALLGIPPGLTLNGSSLPVGTITQSLAFGAVSGGPGSHVGGLIGDNGGSISGLTASQSVIGGENSVVGGLVGRNGGLTSIPGLPSIFATCTQAACIALQNASVSSAPGSIAKSQATGNVTGGVGSVVGGLVGENPGLISESTASGIVGGGEGSSVGGLVGRNVHGRITLAAATSTVIGGHGSMVGGLVGLNLAGLIQDSFASGSVSGGDGSIAGGLVAANLGTVSRSFASGAVTGGDDSHVGGLVGVNYAIPGFSGDVASGTISQSYATGAATGGAGSTVGGLVADNGGTVDQTYATGLVTGGPGSTTGGLIAVNSATFVVPDGLLSDGGGPASVTAALGGPTETGTVTFSYWDKQTTGQASSDGGTGLTTAQFNSGLPAGFDPAVWGVLPGESYPFLHGQPVGTIQPVGPLPPPPPDVTPLPPLQEVLLPPPPQQQVVELRQTDPQPTGEVVSTQSPPTTGSTSRPSDQASGRGPLRPDGRPSNVPPIGETRFINNEVVFQICSDVPAQRIQSTMRRLRLDLLSSQSLGLIGCTVYHSRITNGRPVRDIIIALERDRLIDEVTPNYTFALAQDASAPAAAGEAAQYAVAKLRLAEAHQLAKGDDVLIAVIDSEIDAKHPDLEGAIAARYDAVGPADKPHPHGTGMAGAIASHRKLIGTAPGARLLAIRAFGSGSGGAQGTTVQIVKGIDWAISQGAKIVNMSFAGPKDPTLQKAFKAALDKSVVLIAAAGNAGPKSPPLYPGADPSVIAVSATDADDQVYTNANRGKYVAVAAPGVDILVLAPEGNYELTTGTSVASAEVSGVAALLLQRDPKMDPATVREILTSTANLLGAKGRTDELGYGLVDAYKALLSVNAKSASAPGAVAATSRN